VTATRSPSSSTVDHGGRLNWPAPAELLTQAVILESATVLADRAGHYGFVETVGVLVAAANWAGRVRAGS
jgi:hypothetical protein